MQHPSGSAEAPAIDLLPGPPQRSVVFDGTHRISAQDFAGRVRALAQRLPEGEFLIPLCEDRAQYLAVLCAAALRGQVALLPAAPVPDVIAQLRARHPRSYVLSDAPGRHPDAWVLPDALAPLDGSPLRVPASQVAVIGFTSGSTGTPTPNAKTWGSFATSNRQNMQALQPLWSGCEGADIVATVPSQHMYGMEMTAVMPLLGPHAVHAARPFFPADVAQAVEQARAPRCLVTTPVHLRALLASDVDLPELACITSATAPLPVELARAAEARYRAPLIEFFGSTETCIFASRRTAIEAAWTPMADVRLLPQATGTLVHAPQLAAPVALADVMQLDGEGRFRVLGRAADLLEIAGKRASLAALTRRLLAIEGVEDAVVFQLDEVDAAGVRRIAALVVAPAREVDAIQAVLRSAIDPVFLPRPLVRVDALPRNATGKLTRADLLAALAPR